MKPRPKKKIASVSSVGSEKSESDGYYSNSDASSATMASMKSQFSKRSMASAATSKATSRATSRATSATRDSSPFDNGSPGSSIRPAYSGSSSGIVADFKTTAGLTRLIQSTIAKLKKKGGCPITTIKKDIKENHGFALTGTHNTRRLNAVLKNLQKEGTLVKTARGYKLVPIAEARRRHRRARTTGRRRRRRRGARRGRKRRRMGRGRRRYRRKRGTHSRRRRQRHRVRHGRRRRGRRGRRGRRRATAPKSAKLRRGVSTLGGSSKGGLPRAPLKGPSAGGAVKDVPGGSSLHIASRNPSRVPSRLPSSVPSRVPSRAPSRLPSRSHSPARPSKGLLKPF